MEPIETIEYKGMTIKIYQDDDTESPRDWDNMGTMICFHNKYNLGDKHSYQYCDYDSWTELQEAVRQGEDAVIMLPLGLYDHSGITMYIGNSHDRWDGVQVGWIVVSKESIRKNYGVKRITKKILEQAEKGLRSEVTTYDQFLKGDVYGYDTGDDSCWGFYGIDEAINEAKGSIDYTVKKNQEKHEQKLKEQIVHHVPFKYRTV